MTRISRLSRLKPWLTKNLYYGILNLLTLDRFLAIQLLSTAVEASFVLALALLRILY